MLASNEYFREYRKKNRVKLQAYQRAYNARYREEHKEELREYLTEWLDKNKERVRSVKANLYKKNPRKKLHTNRMWWLRRKQAVGSFTLEEWEQLKEIYNYTCLKCLRSEPEVKLTQDHKVALINGGTNTIDNIQPLCGPCNSAKREDTWFASCRLNIGY